MRRWFDLSSAEALAASVTDAVALGFGARGAPPVEVALQQAWADASAAEAQVIVDAARALLEEGEDDVRSVVLGLLDRRSGAGIEALLTDLVEHQPGWLLHDDPRRPGERLGRSLLRAALGDVGRKRPDLWPRLEALAPWVGARQEWVLFLVDRDAEGAGFDALTAWVATGERVDGAAAALGIAYGSWGRARLLEVAALLSGQPAEAREVFLVEALVGAGPGLEGALRAALGMSGSR